MSQFLEIVVLPLLVALVAYAIADQRKWTPKSRFWTVTIALVFAVVIVFVARPRQNVIEQPQPSPTPTKSHTAPPPATPHSNNSRRPRTAEEEFIEKYVADSNGSAQPPGWTVLFSGTSMNDFSALYAAAGSILSQKGHTNRPLFRPKLLQDSAAYDELYDADPALLKRLSAYREGFLVGKVRSKVSQNASLDIFSAHLFVQLRVISTRQGQILSRVATDETGAGFSQAAALSAAEQRIAAKMRAQLIRSIPAQ